MTSLRLLVLALWPALFAAPQALDAAPARHPYAVVTTVGMITDITRQVAGDKAVVSGIIGEGIDPHLYKPTRGDVAMLLGADVIFYNGLLLEGKMADALMKVARGGRPVVAVTESIDPSYLLTPGEFKGHHDPHVWMDPQAWIKAVGAVAAALSSFDPDSAAYYAANADACIAEIRALDEYAKAALSSIPPSARVMITAHDAFNYFGRAYALEVVGIQGLSTESEAGLEEINRLVDLIVERKIPSVFVESSVSDKNVRALVEGARSRGAHQVRIGGSLFSDAMGGAGTYEGTYIGMMDHNVTLVTRALGGEAPERGLRGRLTWPGGAAP